MKKIIEAMKIAESVGRKVLGRATEEDHRTISGWEQSDEGKDKLFQKISDPDFIQEKSLYYKNFDIAKAWNCLLYTSKVSLGRW